MEQCIQSNLMEANTIFSDNAPPTRLFETGFDKTTRPKSMYLY